MFKTKTVVRDIFHKEVSSVTGTGLLWILYIIDNLDFQVFLKCSFRSFRFKIHWFFEGQNWKFLDNSCGSCTFSYSNVCGITTIPYNIRFDVGNTLIFSVIIYNGLSIVFSLALISPGLVTSDLMLLLQITLS